MWGGTTYTVLFWSPWRKGRFQMFYINCTINISSEIAIYAASLGIFTQKAVPNKCALKKMKKIFRLSEINSKAQAGNY